MWVNIGSGRAYVNVPITISLAVSNVANLGAFSADLRFNPASVSIEAIGLGSFANSTGRTFVASGQAISNVAGTANAGYFSLGTAPPGPSGNGVLLNIRVLPKLAGTSPFTLSAAQMGSVDGQPITFAIVNGSLTIENSCFGDYDYDGDIDILDVQRVAYRWNTHVGDGVYEVLYDGDHDGDIDILDVQRVAYRWSTRCSDWPDGKSSDPKEVKGSSEAIKSLEAILSVQKMPAVLVPGKDFTVTVELANVENLGAYEFELGYDPAVLVAVGVVDGGLLGSTSRPVFATVPARTKESVAYGAFTTGASHLGPKGTGTLAQVRFRVVGCGSTAVVPRQVKLAQIGGSPIQATAVGAKAYCLGTKINSIEALLAVEPRGADTPKQELR